MQTKTSGIRRVNLTDDDLRAIVKKAYLEGHADGVIQRTAKTGEECWLDSSTSRKLDAYLA